MRTLPHSIDLEESVLASCMLGYGIEVFDLIGPDVFYRTSHRLWFSAMRAALDDSVVDPAMVVENLRTAGNLEKAGGGSYLGKLMDAPIAGNIETACRRLRELSMLRNLIAACGKIASQCYEVKNGDATNILDSAQSEVMSIGSGIDDNHAVSIGQISGECYADWEKMSANPQAVTGITSGFIEIDRITNGWQPEFIILAARPGMGKTALAMNMARNAAATGTPVGVFSLEMGKKQLVTREASRGSRLNSQRFRNCDFSVDEWEKINHTVAKFHNMPLYIDDTPAMHYMEIRRKARAMVREHGCKIFYIDYLQLARGDEGHGREQEISSISRAFKSLSKDIDAPIIALSQLNRNLENRTNKRPALADLRESGSLEQDTDVVVFIYREDYYQGTDEKKSGKSEIIFAKNRNGRTGMVELAFIEYCVAFENLHRAKNHKGD